MTANAPLLNQIPLSWPLARVRDTSFYHKRIAVWLGGGSYFESLAAHANKVTHAETTVRDVVHVSDNWILLFLLPILLVTDAVVYCW